jgi:four helix bundle protein
MDLVDKVYAKTADWPVSERFGLISQVRRAVVSVPANIAEGHGRQGRKEFAHHASIAHGSLTETETLLIIASRQCYLPEEELKELLSCSVEVGKLLSGLTRSLNQSGSNRPS